MTSTPSLSDRSYDTSHNSLHIGVDNEKGGKTAEEGEQEIRTIRLFEELQDTSAAHLRSLHAGAQNGAGSDSSPLARKANARVEDARSCHIDDGIAYVRSLECPSLGGPSQHSCSSIHACGEAQGSHPPLNTTSECGEAQGSHSPLNDR